MTPRNERERLEAVWRQKLHTTEEAYAVALAEMRQIQADLESLPPSDGVVALEKAVKLQSKAMDEYARVLQTFTRLILYGEMPAVEPEAVETKPVSDFDVQEWVFNRHGFVPHPAWIGHCRELYLGTPPDVRSHDCPLDKRAAIKQAFVHFGLLPR